MVWLTSGQAQGKFSSKQFLNSYFFKQRAKGKYNSWKFYFFVWYCLLLIPSVTKKKKKVEKGLPVLANTTKMHVSPHPLDLFVLKRNIGLFSYYQIYNSQEYLGDSGLWEILRNICLIPENYWKEILVSSDSRKRCALQPIVTNPKLCCSLTLTR